jgi:hypothetical protein
MQRLELIVVLMLARHRQAPTDAAGGVRPVGFATEFLSLPSGLLEMIADAVAHKNLKESISDLYSDLSD